MAAATAWADPPAPRVVEFTFRSDPGDPASDIIYVVRLSLSPADQDGNSIGWQIDSAYFATPAVGGGWIEWSVPNGLDTGSSDGLWWIEHANPANPQVPEFTEPPALAGTASAITQGADDLEFELVGKSAPVPPPEQSPYGARTAYISSRFAPPEEEPDHEETDEPVEVDDAPN